MGLGTSVTKKFSLTSDKFNRTMFRFSDGEARSPGTAQSYSEASLWSCRKRAICDFSWAASRDVPDAACSKSLR